MSGLCFPSRPWLEDGVFSSSDFVTAFADGGFDLPDRFGRHLRPTRIVGQNAHHAAGNAEAAGEHVQEDLRASDLPAVQVTGGGVAPEVTGEVSTGLLDLVGQAFDRVERHPAFLGHEGRGVLRVELRRRLDIALVNRQRLGQHDDHVAFGPRSVA